MPTPPSIFLRAAIAYSTIAAGLCVVAAKDAQSADVAEKSGAQLFYSLCASCHGTGALGDGPVATLLVLPPPDLTRIAQRHGGVFPDEQVRSVIDGRTGRAAHGTRSMPVWGRQLYFSHKPDDAAARAHADRQIALLVEYVRTLQK